MQCSAFAAATIAFRKFAPAAILSVALLLPSPGAAQTNVAIPDTPAGRMLGQWLQAFNSDDNAVVRKFYDEHMPEILVARAVDFRQLTGGVDLVAVKGVDPLRVIFLAKDRKTPTLGLGVLTLPGADAARASSLSLRGVPPNTVLTGFAIDDGARRRVIDAAAAALNDAYVDPAVAQKMEADLRTRLARGEFAKISDGDEFADTLTNALRSVSHDKHLGVSFVPAQLPPPPPPPAAPPPAAAAPAQLPGSRCGFQPATLLANRIGLIKFNGFSPVAQCREAASVMLNSLGEVDAIIFDLRDNGGGEPAMVAYIGSYLFGGRTHFTDIWTRKTNETREYWTQTDAPGRRYATQPVFVLTSSRTFSGAEDFSYSLQALKRAVIVGEVTGGGAHPVRGQLLSDGFSIGVPYAKTVNPITKSNWEGVGVEPDVKVAAPQALETAQKLATQAAGRKQ
jgi:hypothetical protein